MSKKSFNIKELIEAYKYAGDIDILWPMYDSYFASISSEFPEVFLNHYSKYNYYHDWCLKSIEYINGVSAPMVVLAIEKPEIGQHVQLLFHDVTAYEVRMHSDKYRPDCENLLICAFSKVGKKYSFNVLFAHGLEFYVEYRSLGFEPETTEVES